MKACFKVLVKSGMQISQRWAFDGGRNKARFFPVNFSKKIIGSGPKIVLPFYPRNGQPNSHDSDGFLLLKP